MKDEEFFELTIQSIPIIFALSYLLFPTEFVGVSYSILGKLIAISLIVIYTFKHIVYGFLVSSIMMWYYQMELDQYWREGFDKSEYLPQPSSKRGSAYFKPTVESDLTSYDQAYPDNLEPMAKEGEAVFRKKYCRKGKLQHKEMDVKNEYAPHIYPEMEFSDKPCNPCDETCRIEVKKQKTQTILEPIQTRGIMDTIKSIVPDSGIPFVGTGKEQATILA